MSEKHGSLSGNWTGVYDYPDNVGQPVPFTAIITDIDGELSGDIDEPHMGLAQDLPQSAALHGTHANGVVSFVKTYLSLSHSVTYRGDVNGALTRIEGIWSIPGDWSGPFVMDRTSPPPKEVERRIAEKIGEPVDTRI